MNALTSTWQRRLVVATGVTVLAVAVMLALVINANGDTPGLSTIGDVMKRLVLLPGLLGFAVLLFTTAFASTRAVAATSIEPATAMTTTDSGKPFVAQVVGLEWLNPLQRRDYPTEWQILWTMGLVKPNQNDDMVRTEPRKFTSLQSIGGIVDSNGGREVFEGIYEKYIDQLLLLLADRYVMNGKYFYTVQPKDRARWRELAGVRVELAVPARLESSEAQTYLRNRMKTLFEIGSKSSPDLWSRDTLPDVHVTQGGANAGFASLNKALDFLKANPDKTVWVMNWDAPSYPPRGGQINENMVLLFLAGPDFKTEREPLAWIGRAATSSIKDFDAKAGTTRAVQAWKAVIETAAQNGGIAVPSLNYVVHDAGKGSDAASARLGSLSQTLTEVLPEYDFRRQVFNAPSLLGDMGAGTALTDVILAIGRANHLGENVLVAGTTNQELPMAVVVVPPSKSTPIEPNRDWFRARGENDAYLPWWGRRHDEKYSGAQGYSW
ncbi:virulence factor [Burkholderia arboris]|uniref:virulence factor n=1 Tax=Burkholderia arboris TaxID=488730 RepID=UPI0030F15313